MRLSDGTSLRLYRQTVEDYAIYAGREVDDAELERLRIDAGKMSAKMRAVRIVTASDVSKRDLKQRLIQKGEDPAQAEEAVAWMSELDLVDDARTAQILVRRCAAKGYGLARAKQALYEKKVPKAYWDDALEHYPDQTDKIEDFLRSRLDADSDDKEIKKAIDALLRRGHSYGTIRRALNELSFEAEEFPEEY